jgi:PAS domain S-box-containing protein
MLLNSRTTRLLLEAAEEVGLSRSSVIDPLGLVEADLVDVDVKVEWNTVALMCEQLSRLVNGDVERLREVGRRMSRVPSYEPFRRLAGALLTVRALYDVANRYAGPANFPHLRLEAEFTRDGRMRLHAEIPASYAPSAAFLHITSGSVAQLPVLLGLPPSKIVACRVTPRTLDLVVELPESRSFVERVRRGARALLVARRAIAVLEEQHLELASNVEALRRARDELRTLLHRLPDLVVVHAGGKIVWANGAFLSALSYDAEDLVGRPFADVIVGRPAALFDEPPTSVPGGARAPVLVEVTLRTRSGAHVTVEVAPPQKVVFDGVTAQLVVGRDITDRKRLHESLIIADRLASVGLLAAGVAHEVNNPLAYVLNSIEIARRELVGLGTGADVSRQALSVALEGVERIRTIVRDLLVLARGHDEPVRPVDVHAVVESTLALAAYDISRTANLVRDLRPAPPVLASDGRIAQVLLNLVTNALEAMRDRPREKNDLVVRVSSTPDGRLLLEVGDTGRGIAADDLPRLFEPFFTTKPMGTGTGLGLSIAQRLVTELGGEIHVSSVLGSGTTFRVILPSAPDEPEHSGAGEPQESPRA